MSNTFQLETERLILRPFTSNDVAAFAPICADPDVMRYIGNGPHDEATTEKRIQQWIANYERNGFGLLALIHKQDNCLIGFCGLIPQIVDGESFIELGYRLAKAYWDQGLATEAATTVRDYAFTTLKLENLISIIHPENTASKKVAKKVGMKLLRQTQFQGIPVEIYGIKPPQK